MATKTFANFDDLIAHIGSGIQDALEGDAQEIVKEKISKSARERVILETDGRETAGIDDMASMEGEVTIGNKVFKLKVKDTASPAPSVFDQPFDQAKNAAVGGTMFANWIEDGKWIDLKAMLEYRRGIGWNPKDHEKWSDYKTRGMPKSEWKYKPRREARPFIKPVQQELEQNPQEILDAIEKSIYK